MATEGLLNQATHCISRFNGVFPIWSWTTSSTGASTVSWRGTTWSTGVTLPRIWRRGTSWYISSYLHAYTSDTLVHSSCWKSFTCWRRRKYRLNSGDLQPGLCLLLIIRVHNVPLHVVAYMLITHNMITLWKGNLLDLRLGFKDLTIYGEMGDPCAQWRVKNFGQV